MTKVLSFNLEKEKETAVKLLCLRMGFQFEVIDPERQHETLGELCGVAGFSSSVRNMDDLFTDEMLVFYGLTRQELNELLDLMRSKGQTVVLKAVVTDTNINWSATRVYRAVHAEHRNMESMKQKKKQKKHK